MKVLPGNRIEDGGVGSLSADRSWTCGTELSEAGQARRADTAGQVGADSGSCVADGVD